MATMRMAVTVNMGCVLVCRSDGHSAARTTRAGCRAPAPHPARNARRESSRWLLLAAGLAVPELLDGLPGVVPARLEAGPRRVEPVADAAVDLEELAPQPGELLPAPVVRADQRRTEPGLHLDHVQDGAQHHVDD